MKLDFKHIEQIYFIGIGGIGMSALAFHFIRLGKTVYGYDRIESEISNELEDKGALIEYDFNLKLAKQIQYDKSLIIFTPAVKSNQPVYNYFKSNNFELYKRAEILGQLSKNSICIAVAGTHGKTTITSMLAFLLKENDEPVTAYLGGVSENYQSNYIHNGDGVMVVEADEFDKSLLQLQPDYALISNIDADHLDIYKNKEDLEQAFFDFSRLVEDHQKLFHLKGLPLNGQSISVESKADHHQKNLRIENGAYIFDWVTPHHIIKDVKLKMPGKHNLFNALAALALASAYKPEKAEDFANSLHKFIGVKRRFNYIKNNLNKIIIDDYAHHPAEIKAVLEAIKEMHAGESIMAIFQPHLFSRTRDFANEFAEILSQFDNIKLLDIYPARETPIEGITAEYLCSKIKNDNKEVIQKDDILPAIKTTNCEVIALMGAGDIGVEINKLKKIYTHES